MALGLSAFLPQTKRRGASVGAFAFPSAEPAVPPSLVADDMTRLVRLANLLCGALIGSLIVSLALTAKLVLAADVEPYVADGGVFGCRVPVIEESRS